MFKKLALATVATMVFVVPAVAGADVVTDWNRTMVGALVTAASPPPLASRDAAIVQASVFDAVNGIARRYTPVHVPPRGPAWGLAGRSRSRCGTRVVGGSVPVAARDARPTALRDARSDRSTR